MDIPFSILFYPLIAGVNLKSNTMSKQVVHTARLTLPQMKATFQLIALMVNDGSLNKSGEFKELLTESMLSLGITLRNAGVKIYE